MTNIAPIYGGVSQPSWPVIDKVYETKKQALEAAAQDNVMLGRFVLIKYCETELPAARKIEIEALPTSEGLVGDELQYYNSYHNEAAEAFGYSKDRMVLQKIAQRIGTRYVSTYSEICYLNQTGDTSNAPRGIILERVEYNDDDNTIALIWKNNMDEESITILSLNEILSADMDQIDSKINILNNSCETLLGRVSTVEGQASTNKTNINRLNTNHNNLATTVGQLQSNITNHNNTLNSITTQLSWNDAYLT